MAHARTGKSVLAYYIYSFHFIIHRRDNLFWKVGFPSFPDLISIQFANFFFVYLLDEGKIEKDYRGADYRPFVLSRYWGGTGGLGRYQLGLQRFKKKAAVFVFIILFKSKNSFLDGKKVFFFLPPEVVSALVVFLFRSCCAFPRCYFQTTRMGLLPFLFSDFLPCERFPPQKRRTHRIRSIWNRAHSSRIVMT